METLEKLIVFYAKNKLNLTQETNDTALTFAIDGLKDEMIKEIENERGALLKEKMQKEFNNEKKLERLKELKKIILEVLFLSFIVGMIVNQSTEIINSFNPNNEKRIILIILFLILVSLPYIMEVSNHLIKFIKNKEV